MDFVQHILNGLLQGCILALVGLGFSLVWGILNIINLAHAAFIMLGRVPDLLPVVRRRHRPVRQPAADDGRRSSRPATCSRRYVINLVMGASVLTTFLLTFGFESCSSISPCGCFRPTRARASRSTPTRR